MDLTPFEPAAVALRDVALAYVQDERGVRVEDYVTVLAAATGEAAIVASGVIDIEHNELTPGAAVFGDAINEVLSGDATDVTAAPPTSVAGALRDRVVPDVVGLDAVPSLDHCYQLVAGAVGEVPWGQVAVTVPEEHRPTVLPLQAAFDLRPAVVAVCARVDDEVRAGRLPSVEGWDRHVLCALALGSAIEQAREALDPATALTLAFEVTFGMAKTVPMSQAAFDAAAADT